MKNNSLDILKKQGSGFKIPKGYFKAIENEVFSKVSAEKFPEKEGFSVPTTYFETVEKDVIQKLAQNKKANEIPQNYFETLEDKVFEKLKNETIKQPKVITFSARFVKIIAPIAVAASLLLFFTLQYNNNQTDFTIDEIANADIENWVDENLITLDSYEIAEVFSDVYLNDELDLDDAEVLNYFNGTDIEMILLNN